MSNVQAMKNHQESRDAFIHTLKLADKENYNLAPILSLYMKDDEVPSMTIMFPEMPTDQEEKTILHAVGFAPNSFFDFEYVNLFTDVLFKMQDKKDDETIDDVKIHNPLREDPEAVEAVMGITADAKGVLCQSLDEYGRQDDGSVLFKEYKLHTREDNKDMMNGGMITHLLESSFDGREKIESVKKKGEYVQLVQQGLDMMSDMGFKIAFSNKMNDLMQDLGIIDEDGVCTHECDCDK